MYSVASPIILIVPLSGMRPPKWKQGLLLFIAATALVDVAVVQVVVVRST